MVRCRGGMVHTPDAFSSHIQEIHKHMNSRSFYKPDLSSESKPQTLLSRHDAAARLSVSLATLDRLTRAGELPRVKLPGKVLYRPESLDAFARSKESWVANATAVSSDLVSPGPQALPDGPPGKRPFKCPRVP